MVQPEGPGSSAAALEGRVSLIRLHQQRSWLLSGGPIDPASALRSSHTWLLHPQIGSHGVCVCVHTCAHISAHSGL